MSYQVGQVFKGTLKEDPSIKAHLLIVELRNNRFHVINIRSCFSVKFHDDPFRTLEDVSEFINTYINIDSISHITDHC